MTWQLANISINLIFFSEKLDTNNKILGPEKNRYHFYLTWSLLKYVYMYVHIYVYIPKITWKRDIHSAYIILTITSARKHESLSSSQVKEVGLCPWWCYMLHILYRETQHCNTETELQLSSAELLRGWAMQIAFAIGILLNLTLGKEIMHFRTVFSNSLSKHNLKF